MSNIISAPAGLFARYVDSEGEDHDVPIVAFSFNENGIGIALGVDNAGVVAPVTTEIGPQEDDSRSRLIGVSTIEELDDRRVYYAKPIASPQARTA